MLGAQLQRWFVRQTSPAQSYVGARFCPSGLWHGAAKGGETGFSAESHIRCWSALQCERRLVEGHRLEVISYAAARDVAGESHAIGHHGIGAQANSNRRVSVGIVLISDDRLKRGRGLTAGKSQSRVHTARRAGPARILERKRRRTWAAGSKLFTSE